MSALLCALAIMLGCSGSDALNSPTADRLKKLSTMYLDYAVQGNGGGPASEDVLKKHIRNSDGRTLQANGIDKNEIDSLFISERDQQPFVVIYGIGIRQGLPVDWQWRRNHDGRRGAGWTEKPALSTGGHALSNPPLYRTTKSLELE